MERLFDLSNMTADELEKVVDILTAYRKFGAPEDFWDEGVQIAHNEYSGLVFLTNADYQVAVYNEYTDRLESFYCTPYSGYEGTYEDLVDIYEQGMFTEIDDLEYLRDIARFRKDTAMIEKLTTDIDNLEDNEEADE